MRAAGGVRSRESSTTRSGWRVAPGRRTSSRGSSASTVPLPVITAEERARRRCTSSRAASPVIQRLSPPGSAVPPSRLAASLTVTQGLPRVMREMKPGFSSRGLALEDAALDRDARAASARRRRRRRADSGSRIA